MQGETSFLGTIQYDPNTFQCARSAPRITEHRRHTSYPATSSFKARSNSLIRFDSTTSVTDPSSMGGRSVRIVEQDKTNIQWSPSNILIRSNKHERPARSKGGLVIALQDKSPLPYLGVKNNSFFCVLEVMKSTTSRRREINGIEGWGMIYLNR